MIHEDHYDPDSHEPMPEGEEEAPPLVRTMSAVRWVLLAGMTVFALVMFLTYLGLTPWAAQGSGNVQYHCPMHPTYISGQPGDCPICGMSLVPIDAETGDSSTVTVAGRPGIDSVPRARPGQYICTMCPEVIADEPGRCPKCGMFLTKVPDTATTYVCPMHTEVTSEKPGTCPTCGMALVAAEQDTSVHAMHDSGMGSAPVPGLVPVTIEARRLQLIGVRTARAARRPADGKLRLVGFVTPDETRVANVHVRTDGWIQELYVDETGQFVEEEESLLTIYSQDLYQAEQDFKVARDAALTGEGDSLVMEMHRRVLDAARERLRLLGLSDNDITAIEHDSAASWTIPLRSPFTGYVLEKNVNEGQYVTPGQSMFTIADLSNVWVLVDVYESDLPFVRLNQPVEMTLDALPGHTVEGRIAFIYPTVSERTRTLKVRLEFPNPDLALRPGMYADVAVARGGPEMLAVPAPALMDGGETQYVFVVHDGIHFEPRRVTVGRRSDDWVEILTGVDSGEEVVTSANFLIDSESRLQAAITGMSGAPAESHEGHGH